MANLVSPGVQVQVIDESFYASAGPGTVPFIMMATAQDKLAPGSSTAIASGTTKANANQLYTMTSQRELLQTFGNPLFYTQAGTPQHGNELNEYGLYAAYQYLGIANTALVMRADIDLGALTPSSTEPTGPALNGDHWLDLSQTSYGIFRSNGNVNPQLSWAAQSATVIADASMLEIYIHGLTSSVVSDAHSAIGLTSGNVTICGIAVTVTNLTTWADLVNLINSTAALQQKGISAELFGRDVILSDYSAVVTGYNLRIKCTNIATIIDLVGTTSGNAKLCGFEIGGNDNVNPTNFIAPLASTGKAGDFAVNAVNYLDMDNNKMVGLQIFEKIVKAEKDGTTSTRWYLVGSTDTTNPGFGWQEARPTMVTGTKSLSFTSTTFNSYATLITMGNSSWQFSASPQGLAAFVESLNALFLSKGWNAWASVVTSGIKNYLQITNYDGSSIGLIDEQAGANGNFGYIAGINTGQTYYKSVTSMTTISGSLTAGNSFTITTSTNTATIEITGPGVTIAQLVSAINGASEANITVTGNPSSLVTASLANNLVTITSKTGSYFTLTDYGLQPILDTVLLVPTGTTYGTVLTFQNYTSTQPQPSLQSQMASDSVWINTASANRGANYILDRYNSGTATWQTIAALLEDTDANANAGLGPNRSNGSAYVQYDSNMDGTATFTVKLFNGTAWVNAVDYNSTNSYTQSVTAPTGKPVEGALWYNSNLQVDILVSNGESWLAYNVAYPSTDPLGPTLSATAPTYQQQGTNPLVDNDLWIDTADLENYPKIYRYDGVNMMWNLIDNTDQSSSAGIVFGDARPNASCTRNGATDVVSMLTTNPVVLDSDAPSALSYPAGVLLFNTRFSTYNVKEYKKNYLTTNPADPTWLDRWVTASGLKADGSPYMGRKAQRVMVTRAMAGAMTASQDLRSEVNFFNIMATPGYAELLSEMITLNTDIKEVAFICVDTPARLQPDGTSIEAWANNTANATDNGEEALINSSPYAGVYYPWGLGVDLNGSPVFVPPSVVALRTLAFNDQVAYPWFPPAGFTRGLVSVVSSVGYLSSENEYVPVTLNQGQRDVLYTNKINPIAYIPGRGLVVYGQKTLDPVSTARDRVNVARLVNYLNYQLDNLAKPFLFELNDQQTRDAVTKVFETFMSDLVALRAMYDYAVLCDATNNTSDRIDRNELWIDVAIKPEKAIEFIYIPLRILNTSDVLPH